MLGTVQTPVVLNSDNGWEIGWDYRFSCKSVDTTSRLEYNKFNSAAALKPHMYDGYGPPENAKQREGMSMLNQLHRNIQEHRRELYALTLLGILLLFMLEPLNSYLAWSLLYGYGLYLFVVLAAFYLYFHGLRDGWEIRLAVAFVLWHALSRILLGDVVLQKEGYLVMKGPLMVCMLSVGLVLSRKQRRRFLHIFGGAAAIFFTLLGLMDLYSYVTRKALVYARTDVITGIVHGFRMQILGYHPNTVGFWYLLSSALLVYLFLDCRRKAWRIPLAVMLLIHYLTLATTFSRNSELNFSACAGLLAALLLEKKLRVRKKTVRAALLVLTALLAGFLCFKGFGFGTGMLGKIHESLKHPTVTATAAEPTTAERRPDHATPVMLSFPVRTLSASDTEIPFQDPRSLTNDSQRFLIYKTVPEIFRQEPMRLLRGCFFDERLSISNPLLPENKTMLHDSWLEILNYMGIPGLLLFLAFTVLVLKDCFKLYFSTVPEHTTAIKSLVLPVLAGFSFSILESFLWFRTDFMTLSCYLFIGFVIAEVRESCAARC